MVKPVISHQFDKFWMHPCPMGKTLLSH